jgi:eukaryotic-like serine/threonine-protein kinase
MPPSQQGGAPRPASPAPAAPAASGPPPAGRGARFIPQEEIGRGPKGVVHRGGDANAPGSANSVALRLLAPEPLQAEGAMNALAADLKGAAALVHPNLVKLIGFVDLSGKKCVVSELVPGKNFAEPLLAGRRVPFAHVLKLTRMLGETLGLIHGRGLVHGGISPSNLLATGGVVKLADLGLGRVYQQVTKAREYWPPDGKFEPATDLYAAAATVYHLLTGIGPRNRPTPATSPSALVPGVPASFDALLLRALDPKPQNRFPTATALVQALDQLSGPAA